MLRQIRHFRYHKVEGTTLDPGDLRREFVASGVERVVDMFGGVSCSVIAKANEGFSAKITKDRKLGQTADKISRKMSYVTG